MNERKSKGKRHPLYADSLMRMARELTKISSRFPVSNITMAKIFRKEGKRVRSIVR